MGFPRQEYWNGLSFPSPGNLLDLGIKPSSPALAGGFFTTEPPEKPCVTFSSVQSLSHVRLFVTPWIAACQASLSIINSRSSLRITSIESVMPSSHLNLCCPLNHFNSGLLKRTHLFTDHLVNDHYIAVIPLVHRPGASCLLSRSLPSGRK